MKAHTCLVIFSAILMVMGCDDKPNDPPAAVGPPIEWVNTTVFYDTTIDKKDYSLILFEAAWCGYCQQMRQITLVDPEVATIMNESFNCAAIDIEADTLVAYFDSMVTCQQFTEIYEVSGIPQTHILDYNGTWLGKIIGYRDPDSYAYLLDKIRNGSLDP